MTRYLLLGFHGACVCFVHSFFALLSFCSAGLPPLPLTERKMVIGSLSFIKKGRVRSISIIEIEIFLLESYFLQYGHLNFECASHLWQQKGTIHLKLKSFPSLKLIFDFYMLLSSFLLTLWHSMSTERITKKKKGKKFTLFSWHVFWWENLKGNKCWCA